MRRRSSSCRQGGLPMAGDVIAAPLDVTADVTD
jgi:hypothetical protein